MTGRHNLFRLYALVICHHCPPPPTAQGNVEDFDFVSAVPHSNHHTVGTSSWQNHNSSSPQSVIILTAMVVYVYQTPTFPPHYGDNVNVKSQHSCQDISALLRGLDEAVVTNEWCIIYSLWCTSHKNLVFSHNPPPQKKNKQKNKQQHTLTPSTKYDIRWYIFNSFPSTFPPQRGPRTDSRAMQQTV